ncbi:hypothetical protein MLD38_010800 [Melastoma candidum]|uniref:Uncharacterized protein n=1 Tax=Melastoma candidum TaxID=119954 RepID=A0ACB9R551_9MYRT|nr:hypothetical protein MLD38_010800 [Melastoma candidum]
MGLLDRPLTPSRCVARLAAKLESMEHCLRTQPQVSIEESMEVAKLLDVQDSYQKPEMFSVLLVGILLGQQQQQPQESKERRKTHSGDIS